MFKVMFKVSVAVGNAIWYSTSRLFWDTLFRIFSFISCCLMLSASNIPKYLLVPFSPSVLMTTWFGSSTPSVMCRFSLLIFLSQMSNCKHGFPWPSLATRLYRPTLLVGLQGYILYRHSAVLYRFWLVLLLLLVHVIGSTGVYHL